MNKVIPLLSCLALSIGAVGCVTTFPELVYPRGNEQFEVVAFSAKESGAMKEALKKANQTCALESKNMIVLDRTVAYNGVLSEEGNKLADQLSKLASQATGEHIPNGSTSEDYKVTLMIECRAA